MNESEGKWERGDGINELMMAWMEQQKGGKHGNDTSQLHPIRSLALKMAEGRHMFQSYMRLTIPVAFSFTMSFELTIDYHHSQNIRLNFQ